VALDQQADRGQPCSELQVLARSPTTLALQAENLLPVWPQRVGKTHLAIAITMAMIEQDQPCRFFPGPRSVQAAAEAEASYELPRPCIQKVGSRLRLAGDPTTSATMRRNELEHLVLFELNLPPLRTRSLLYLQTAVPRVDHDFSKWIQTVQSGGPVGAPLHIVGIKGESYVRKECCWQGF